MLFFFLCASSLMRSIQSSSSLGVNGPVLFLGSTAGRGGGGGRGGINGGCISKLTCVRKDGEEAGERGCVVLRAVCRLDGVIQRNISVAAQRPGRRRQLIAVVRSWISMFLSSSSFFLLRLWPCLLVLLGVFFFHLDSHPSLSSSLSRQQSSPRSGHAGRHLISEVE